MRRGLRREAARRCYRVATLRQWRAEEEEEETEAEKRKLKRRRALPRLHGRIAATLREKVKVR